MLKVDLIGIVIMIFMMAICGNWLGFVRYPSERVYIIILVCFVFMSNFVLSLLPCYAERRHDNIRYAINIGTVLMCFTLSIMWYFYFANEKEINLFFWPLMLSFFWAAVGFFFFQTGFPESHFKE
jgi:hypothetical protein